MSDGAMSLSWITIDDWLARGEIDVHVPEKGTRKSQIRTIALKAEELLALREERRQAIEAGRRAAEGGSAALLHAELAGIYGLAITRALWLIALNPPARKGVRFDGRPKGSIGRVRKFVRAYLAKKPQATADEVFRAIHRRPPKGCVVDDPFERSRRCITAADGTRTSWRQFQNVVSKERQSQR